MLPSMVPLRLRWRRLLPLRPLLLQRKSFLRAVGRHTASFFQMGRPIFVLPIRAPVLRLSSWRPARLFLILALIQCLRVPAPW